MWVVRAGTTEVQETLEIESRLLGVVTEDFDNLADVVAFVAGAYRSVGCEHGAVASDRECLVTRASEGNLAARHLERRQCRVALVEMHDARIQPHGFQHTHRPDPEQRVLRE